MRLDDSLGEGRLLGAVDADRRQFGDLLGHWQQVDDVAEWFPLKGAVEGGNHHNDAHVGQLLAELDNVGVELPLVDGNHIVALGLLPDFLK